MIKENNKKLCQFRKSASTKEIKGSRKIPSIYSMRGEIYNSDFYGIILGSNSKNNEKLNSKDININSPGEINVNIEGITKDQSQIQSPLRNDKLNNISPTYSINMEESNIKSRNIMSPKDTNYRSSKNNIDYSIYGSIQGININSPKQFNYELMGSIPEKDSNNAKSKSVDKYSYYLKGIIPPFRKKINDNRNMIQSNIENGIKENNINVNNIEKIEENNIINNVIDSKNGNEKGFSHNFSSGIFSEGEAGSKVFSQRGTSKKKNRGLPLVGNKKRKFELSRIKNVGDLDVNGINYNGLKSINVGVNGVKIGDRIIE